MTAALRILQPGLHTTLQDLGRFGSQRLGIPVSGALDAVALRVANVLVGNPGGTAGLEMAALGPSFEVVAASVRIALAGGGAGLSVEGADGLRREIPALRSVRLVRGDRVKVGAIGKSAAAYLAVAGGFAVSPFLGSCSTYVRGGFGGWQGRALQAGDLLPLASDEAGSAPDVELDGFDLGPARTARVVLGPQDDYFCEAAKAAFLGGPYLVTRDADRMGLRLEGTRLEHAKGYNITSDGIAPGSIQVPGSCQPIVLLADRQTTGGYPKIATVISADLAAVGRLRPGMSLSFQAVTIREAQRLRREQEAALARLPQRLTPVRPDGPDLDRLLDANLISGVVNAGEPHI